MQFGLELFQNNQIVVFEKILELILKNTKFEKVNLRLNFFNVQNPLLGFYLLSSKKILTDRVYRFEQYKEITEDWDLVFDFWIKHGVEFTQNSRFTRQDHLDSINILQVYDESYEALRMIIDRIRSNMPIVVFKQMPLSITEDIWTFMKPYWHGMEILDHREYVDSTQKSFMIFGTRR